MASTLQSWREFLSMGGFGLYVWGAYGALWVSFTLGIWGVWRQRCAVLRGLKHDESSA